MSPRIDPRAAARAAMASNRDAAYQAGQEDIAVAEPMVAAVAESTMTPEPFVASEPRPTAPKATVAPRATATPKVVKAVATPATPKVPTTPRAPRAPRTTPTDGALVPAASRHLTGTHGDGYVRINIAIDRDMATDLRIAAWNRTNKRDVSALVRIAVDNLLAKFGAATASDGAALVAEILSSPRPTNAKTNLVNYRLEPVQVHLLGQIAAREHLTSSALLRRAIADVLADEE